MNILKEHWKLLIPVLVLTAIALFPSLSGGWTNWDDEVYVIDNELIRTFSWENVKYWFTAYHHGNYHPFTMISYMWEYSISDMEPNGEVKASVFHMTNFILHLFNTALVFVFALKLTNRKEIAVIVSVLFGVHPMHVESVAWISERKDVLYTFFYLLAINFYLDYVKKVSLKNYFIILLMFVCSLMSKSAATVLPLSIILIDFLQKRKLDKISILDKIPLLALSIVFGILAIKSQNATDSIAKFETFTTFQRMMFASFGALMYPFKFILPIDLTCYHPYPFLVDNGSRLPYFYYVTPLIFAALMGVVAWTYKKTRVVVFGVLFYLVNVALVLQFVSVGSAIYAERYSYVAYIGLAYLIGVGVVWLVDNNRNYKNVIYSLMSGVVLLFTALSFQQSETWNNSVQLWENFNEVYENRPYGEYKIAEYYMRFDDHERTINQFKKITTRFPASPRAYAGIGNMMGKQGKYQEALENYNKAENLALQMKVSVAEIYPNRAITYSILKQYDKAFGDYDKAVAADPKNYKIRVNRAFAYLDNKNYERAIEEYSYVIQFEPRFFNHYFLRGIAYQNLSQFDNAVKDYTISIQLNSQNPNAYHNRAICFEQLKEYKKAYADIQSAQKLGKQENENYVAKLKGLAN